MPDGKPIPGQPKTSPAPLPPIINPVNYSHFEIEPTAMEYLRDRYCKNVEDSSSILDPFQDIQAEGEFKAGDFEKAADYLKRNYGNDEFDFCMRGTGTGGSFWGSENNTKGLSYTIHNTWWGYLMTDAMPLCQSISYTVNSNARMLPLRFEQLFNQTMMGVDQKTFPAERLKEAQELKETCLTALKRKHHARFDNNRVGWNGHVFQR